MYQQLMLSVLLALMLSVSAVFAAQDMTENMEIPDTFAEHKLVLQISDPNPFKQTLVLNVAGNVLKHYGDTTKVDIEVVAFGPGARLLFKGNAHTPRIKRLMAAGIRFSVCNNTLTNMGKKLGYRPQVIEGVRIVPAGAVRILQLNEHGWVTIKP